MASTLLFGVFQRSCLVSSKIKPTNLEFVRFKAKKATSSTQNSGNAKPKYRNWKVSEGVKVHSGQILATQKRLRYHPGLNVVFGKNGTLNAGMDGKIIVTCEVAKPNWSVPWASYNYEGRESSFYKKFYHVIPEPQHHRFKCVAAV